MNILLTRDEFRTAVFERDSGKCIYCQAPAVDAHHIMERRLWPDGGYYLNNGASLCEACHLLAEQTTLPPDALRKLAGISSVLLPPHLYADQCYDKWGNILIENGYRLKGELFYDPSVQKILASGRVLGLFDYRVKYPRTYHLPWSPNVPEHDRKMASVEFKPDDLIVVTEKMDGENTTMYSKGIHARSIDSNNHPSRNWVKNLWGSLQWEIPEGWRICGENLWAVHSLEYDQLSSFFLVFSIWNDRNECLSWDETVEWTNLFELYTVPVLYEGPFWNFDPNQFDAQWLETHEGYVLRSSESFPYRDFRTKVGKFVRPQHVQTNEHWKNSYLKQNRLTTK